MSLISRSLDFFVLFYCTYIYGMSGGQSNSYYETMEESEKKRRPTTRQSMPIACRVCDKIFFDNVSLVLHFDESHNEDEVPTPGQQSRTPASLQSDRPLSLNSSQFSFPFVERRQEANHVEVPEMNDYPRPCSLPVFPAKTPNFLSRDVSNVQIPVLNSMPPLTSPFDGRSNVQIPVLNSMPPLTSPFDGRWRSSRPTWLSPMSQRTGPSSLSHPLFCPQVGANRAARGLAAGPLQLNKQNRGGQHSKHRNRQVKHFKKPCKEIIIISDDEDDEQNGPAETLDLTLKL